MSKKQTQIEKAIANLEAEIAVLQLAVARLRTQQSISPKRKPKPVAVKMPHVQEG